MDHSTAARMIGDRKLSTGSANELALSLGYSRISSGSFGAAYRHIKTGVVLKISYTLSDGSMGFVSHCAAYYQKYSRAPKWCPAVYEFGKLPKFWYAVMEFVQCGQEGEDFLDLQHNVGYREACSKLRRDIVELVGFGRFREGGLNHAPRDVDDVYFDAHAGNWGCSMDRSRHVMFDPFSGWTRIKGFRHTVRSHKVHGPARRKRYA